MAGRHRFVKVSLLAAVVAVMAPPAVAQEIQKPATTVYFAEGTVRAGFVELLTIQNPTNSNAHMEVVMTGTDQSGRGVDVSPLRFDVPANSRATKSISEAVGDKAPLDVSLEVRSDKEIAAQRTIYFQTSLAGGVQGVTSSVGVTSTSRTHFFAYGLSNPGSAEEFMAIFNPGKANSRVRIKFLQSATPGSQASDIPDLQVEVPPGTRKGADLGQYLKSVGAKVPLDFSARVDATEPVAAERVLYSKTDDLGGVVGGTAAPGGTEGSGTWYFAEGTARGGQVQNLSVMNLSDKEANLTVRFRSFDRQGKEIRVAPYEDKIPAHSRVTKDLNDVLKTKGLVSDFDVSLIVEANRSIVAERTVRFKNDSAGGTSGLYSVLGTTLPARKLFFPEARVGPDAESAFVVLNPGSSKARIVFKFTGTDQGGQALTVPDLIVNIDGDERANPALNQYLSDNHVSGPADLSVKVDSNVPVVVEQTLFQRSSLAGGVQGGTLVSGFVGKGEGQNVPIPLLVAGVIIIGLAVAAVVVAMVGQRPVDVPEEEPEAA